MWPSRTPQGYRREHPFPPGQPTLGDLFEIEVPGFDDDDETAPLDEPTERLPVIH